MCTQWRRTSQAWFLWFYKLSCQALQEDVYMTLASDCMWCQWTGRLLHSLHNMSDTQNRKNTDVCCEVSRANSLRKIEPSTLRDAPDHPRRCEYDCQPVFTKWPSDQMIFAILDSSVSKGISEPDIKVHRENGRFFACPLHVPWKGFCWDHSRNRTHCQLSGWLSGILCCYSPVNRNSNLNTESWVEKLERMYQTFWIVLSVNCAKHSFVSICARDLHSSRKGKTKNISAIQGMGSRE